MRYVPVLRGKRYANYLWLDPVFQFQAILLPSRARSTNCSSARPEDVCSPGSSRLAPGLDVLRHRAGVLRERRLPRSDLPHEVHRIWNHFPSASVYQKTPTQKRGCRIFYPSPKKRESTLISRGFAAFVSSHLYSMSSRLDTKRNSLTGFSHLWYFFLEICAAKKKKACRRIVSVIRRQN